MGQIEKLLLVYIILRFSLKDAFVPDKQGTPLPHLFGPREFSKTTSTTRSNDQQYICMTNRGNEAPPSGIFGLPQDKRSSTYSTINSKDLFAGESGRPFRLSKACSEYEISAVMHHIDQSLPSKTTSAAATPACSEYKFSAVLPWKRASAVATPACSEYKFSAVIHHIVQSLPWKRASAVATPACSDYKFSAVIHHIIRTLPCEKDFGGGDTRLQCKKDFGGGETRLTCTLQLVHIALSVESKNRWKSNFDQRERKKHAWSSHLSGENLSPLTLHTLPVKRARKHSNDPAHRLPPA
jgi:putative component of membrane protein insertase Oxa1/YidC/SpoIIIJ protein YidD